MQNSQEINWLAILAPSIIGSLSVIIVQILLTFWLSRKTADYQEKVSEKLEAYKKDLSKEIEDYRKELNKELESYKLQIQSDFQTKFYEHQTKFSLLHQEQAKVIQDLFVLLVRLRRNLTLLESIEKTFSKNFSESLVSGISSKKKDQEIETINELMGVYFKLNEFYEEKSIYLNKEICEKIDNLITDGAELMIFHIAPFIFNENFKENLGEEGFKEFRVKFTNIDINKISDAINILENEFRKILYSENPNN